MTIQLNPYLHFNGNAREAAEFYHSVFGGELTIGTFAEFHAAQDPSENDLVMHSELKGEGGLHLMVSDYPERMEYRPGTNFSVSVSGAAADAAVLTTYWEKLSDGGMILQPLAKAVWGDSFGLCVDKFGVTWPFNIAAS
jgi:PhnB protein